MRESITLQLPPGRTPEPLEEFVSRIQAHFKTLLGVWRRRTWPISLGKTQFSRCVQERLEKADWEYTRIAELWKARSHDDTSWHSAVLRDSFKGCLTRLDHTLTDWIRANGQCRGLFTDHEARALSLEAAVKSLNEAMLTWSLHTELDELLHSAYP